MENQFALDKKVMKQLQLIGTLQRRSKKTVHSLYAQAILEYSLYHYNKNQLEGLIDQALEKRDKEAFLTHSTKYNELLYAHREGKTIREDGFEVYLPFE
ncbi:IDEAL domain-containing protein [Bacillus suaedae]|uniref:IDEAL domain-containing protein n=1 Tax=Halalkalibacter suaedae TaxID=2822140 RepID=A0A940WPT1_9BACI|nr:IDEAL domain-containing protein [Bacillus suaedae]MBP3949598.1 IDEAL domain-containing protein [Bacillus suaedae]